MSNKEYYQDRDNKRMGEVFKGRYLRDWEDQKPINSRNQTKKLRARATHHHHPRELIHSTLSVESFISGSFVMRGWEPASIMANRAL